MKTKILIAAISSAIAVSAFAAEVTTTRTTTTTSSGTISEYVPGTTFIVREESGPVKYRYGKEVTYITRKGKKLSDDEVRTRIKVGSPVSVYYSSEGPDRIIEKVEIDD